ncbi:protein of unknown function DUF558 [Magnetococcus marinus MC-1]|uniref:16S rRNA (uracil(1498)-N(3))-methyltransferase n=1 Tax=Magnetococcus marinus (strain ATCC BAA-1437 / JCM 17883 / MC-1) TaxID=156889 RepID=A0L7Y8_MAGMM|nr:protein of unknown function DUF558 [Magnetococcus marinus MC-1]
MECDVPLHPSAAQALLAWQARVGELFTVCHAGCFYRARLLADGHSMRVFATLSYSPEPPAPRVLMQAMPNRERFLWILEKGVELGATAIYPVITEKSYHEDAPALAKQGGWVRILQRAARQCRRAVLPRVGEPLTLEQAIEQGVGMAQWYLDLSPTPLLGEPLQGAVQLFVGPEGGWGEQDLAIFRARGVAPRNLGPRLLRTETAALMALSWIAAADNPLHPGEAGK